MKLVQKLPFGLSVACLLVMSSCSKEDVQTPQPETSKQKTEAEMRGIGGGVLDAMPYFAGTNGTCGLERYADGWQRKAYEGSANAVQFPAGTSGLQKLWGNEQYSWVKALPAIAGITDMSGLLTITTKNTGSPNSLGGKSTVQTTLKNLKAGKKYELTFYVATTMPIFDPNGNQTTYAKEGAVTIINPNGVSGSWSVPLAGKQNQWIKRVIAFTPHSTEAQLEFTGSTLEAGYLAFANLFVDKNSIKQVYY